MDVRDKQAWVTITNKPKVLKQMDWEHMGHKTLFDYVNSIFLEGKNSLKKSGKWDDRDLEKRPFARFYDMESGKVSAFTEGALKAFSDNIDNEIKGDFWPLMIQLKPKLNQDEPVGEST